MAVRVAAATAQKPAIVLPPRSPPSSRSLLASNAISARSSTRLLLGGGLPGGVPCLPVRALQPRVAVAALESLALFGTLVASAHVLPRFTGWPSPGGVPERAGKVTGGGWMSPRGCPETRGASRVHPPPTGPPRSWRPRHALASARTPRSPPLDVPTAPAPPSASPTARSPGTPPSAALAVAAHVAFHTPFLVG